MLALIRMISDLKRRSISRTRESSLLAARFRWIAKWFPPAMGEGNDCALKRPWMANVTGTGS